MGLQDEIYTLEERYQHSGDPETGMQLAIANAEMCVRKGSQRLFWAYFNSMACILEDIGCYDELVKTGKGDPAHMGWNDAQAVVQNWLDTKQGSC